MIFNLLIATFTVYIITCVISSSSLFEPIRKFIMTKTTFLKIGDNKHPIECRLCLGFWFSLFCVLIFNLPFNMIFAVYGMSYWIATLER